MLQTLIEQIDVTLAGLYAQIQLTRQNPEYSQLINDFLDLRLLLKVKMRTILRTIKEIHLMYETIVNAETLVVEEARKVFEQHARELNTCAEVVDELRTRVENFNLRYLDSEEPTKDKLVKLVVSVNIFLVKAELELSEAIVRIFKALQSNPTPSELDSIRDEFLALVDRVNTATTRDLTDIEECFHRILHHLSAISRLFVVQEKPTPDMMIGHCQAILSELRTLLEIE